MTSIGPRVSTLLRRTWSAITSSRTRAVLCIGMLVGLGAVGTLAKWNDQAAATSGEIATGRINILANSEKQHTFSALGMAGMRSGNSKAANLTVGNNGSIPLRYTVAVTGSGKLSPYLEITAFTGGSATNANSVGTCPGGTQVGKATARDGSETALVTAAQTLAATSGSQVLCFVAALAASTPTSASNTTGTLTLTFRATSVQS